MLSDRGEGDGLVRVRLSPVPVGISQTGQKKCVGYLTTLLATSPGVRKHISVANARKQGTP